MRQNKGWWRLPVIVLLLAALVLSGCGDDDKKEDKAQSYTVGVLVPVPQLEAAFEGFKAGMAELGYVEGENITYVYNVPGAGDVPGVKIEAEKLKDQKPDLIFAVANTSAQAAKEVFPDTMPIVAVAIVNPVELGWAASIQTPGGNFTGINTTDSTAKALEWLLRIAPDVKKIYAPNNTLEESSVHSTEALSAAAELLGVETVIADGSTPEEWDTIMTDIPEDADAVFFTDSGPLGARFMDLEAAVRARGIPLFAARIGILDDSKLVGYGIGFYEMGQQAAHLGDNILKGTAAGELPIENAELYLSINLQVAETLGIEISDEILGQAHEVFRAEGE